jgi:multicomponent Na+:H+ antiporter subunit D
MLVAMGISAFLCVAIGCGCFVYLYAALPNTPDYHPYTVPHLITQSQLLWFAILAFVVLMYTGHHADEVPGTNLDVDWIWRRLLRRLYQGVLLPLSLLARGFQSLVLEGIPMLLTAVVSDDPERGLLRDRLILGSSILVVVALLAVYLVIGHNAH